MATKRNRNQPPVSANSNDTYITLEEYEPNIGAPFKVILVDSVRQKISPTGELLETCITNPDGLLKEVAFARSLDDRKFTPEDIKFVRKAVGLKAIDLAELLGISAEHLSRCENGDRTLSIAAEKLLRVVVLKRRHNPAELANSLQKILENDEIDKNILRKMRSIVAKYKNTVEEIESAIFDFKIKTAHDPDDILEFSFHLVTSEQKSFDALDGDLEDRWKEAEKQAA